MKFRNIKVAKIIGTKTLAGLLSVGLAMSAPVAAFAEDGNVAVEQAAAGMQAKTVDGSENLVNVSDSVLQMVQNGEVYLDEASQYLLDAATGQKVNPETGERVAETSGVPETPATPENPGTPETPATPENPSTPENPGTSENPGTTENPTTPENPGTPENPATPENPDDSDNANKAEDSKNDQTAETDKKEEQPAAAPTETKEAENPGTETTSAGSNQALIASQKIVKLPQVVEDFRFWTVARKYAFAKTDLYIRESIPSSEKDIKASEVSKEEKAADLKNVAKRSKILSKTAEKKATAKTEKTFDKQAAQQQLTEGVRAVGQITQDGLLYVLKEEENGWLYVESGNVRGFVRASEVYTGDAAQKLLSVYQKQAKKKAEADKTEYKGIEGTAKTATALVDPSENQAFTYLRATVNQTVVKKEYALVNVDKLNIREEKREDSLIVGTMTQGNLCYILADQDSEWTYIESGDVRGFVKREYLSTGDEVTKQVNETGEEKFATAKEELKPEENDALYYTLTSTKAGTPNGEIRQSMLEFASQFVGNPYVWGGTSLTDGADCSGFVQQIYKQYGYDLPRVAADQAQYGTKIAVEDAQPGDLIFYAKDGDIHHVVMYAGNGKTIEAANENDGIIYGNVDTTEAVWATRILNDQYSVAGAGIGEVNATEDMYGQCLGNFKITYYCACEICCDVETGITATGTPVVEGQTIAVDPNVIPYGTKVIIGGHVFTAEDCGGAIKENRIDVYVNNHADALALGVTNADVYLVK